MASSNLQHRIVFWVLYFVAVCVFVGAGTEIAARAFGLAPPLPTQYSRNVLDAVLPWKPEPNSVLTGSTGEFSYDYRHNSLGFRDVEHEVRKPQNTFRILGLGDSFTYGVGAPFDETILARLERRLNEHTAGSPRIEVIKAGIPRFWPEPERLLLQYYGLQYRPDLVLVVFLPNDVLDTKRGVNGLNVSNGFLVTREQTRLGVTGQWLYVHSAAFRGFAGPILSRRFRNQENAARAAAERADYDLCWRQIEHEYDRMLALTTGAGAAFAVVHIPQAVTDETPTRLAAWCRRNGVMMIDTLPELRRVASIGGKLYYPVDGHCTPEGYRVIAETIYARLTEAKLVPGQTPNN